jgi:4-hydroxy-3-polyprenylbenzoate decarboxylase
MKLVVGITGASGVIYGIRPLQVLQPLESVETHLIVTEMGRRTIGLETSFPMSGVEALADAVYNVRDLAAAVSSGSVPADGMIVAPCSVKTLSAIARSANDNLLTRSADVMLKQRRRLVLLFRETPLHEGHCRLMTEVSRLGAILLPPMPAFYTHPKTIDDLVAQTVGRALDFWGIDLGQPRWEGPPPA